ncbi:MAG: hypothetical protein K6B14_06525 [Lachnospiraceae bacterium]|nr:hypothetical protein [Lachnospiraceae bacterium]
MIAEDLNEMKNDGPDDDFIIKSGSAQQDSDKAEDAAVEAESESAEAVDSVDERLEAAGIEVPHEEASSDDASKEAVSAEASDEDTSVEAEVLPEEDIYIPEDNEPNIDESEEELFAQIDAFRQKASMITALIREKQHRMDQLEDQLHEKEVENLRYQQKLLSMKKEVSARNAAVSREAVAEVAVRAANEAVAKSDDKMSDALKSVEDKMTSMEQSFSGGTDISVIKGDIFDKIHDENVRVYRNIQDYMKERDENDERFKKLENITRETSAKVSVALIVSIIDLLLVGGVLLTVLGVI